MGNLAHQLAINAQTGLRSSYVGYAVRLIQLGEEQQAEQVINTCIEKTGPDCRQWYEGELSAANLTSD